MLHSPASSFSCLPSCFSFTFYLVHAHSIPQLCQVLQNTESEKKPYNLEFMTVYGRESCLTMVAHRLCQKTEIAWQGIRSLRNGRFPLFLGRPRVTECGKASSLWALVLVQICEGRATESEMHTGSLQHWMSLGTICEQVAFMRKSSITRHVM